MFKNMNCENSDCKQLIKVYGCKYCPDCYWPMTYGIEINGTGEACATENAGKPAELA